MKKASAETEPAWKGAGSKVGMQIWRIVKFKVSLLDIPTAKLCSAFALHGSLAFTTARTKCYYNLTEQLLLVLKEIISVILKLSILCVSLCV